MLISVILPLGDLVDPECTLSQIIFIQDREIGYCCGIHAVPLRSPSQVRVTLYPLFKTVWCVNLGQHSQGLSLLCVRVNHWRLPVPV